MEMPETTTGGNATEVDANLTLTLPTKKDTALKTIAKSTLPNLSPFLTVLESVKMVT
jgi:hypothetical protein